MVSVIAQVVLEQLGVPADGPAAAAVGVVAVGSGQAVAVGQAHGGPSPATVRALLSMPRR